MLGSCPIGRQYQLQDTKKFSKLPIGKARLKEVCLLHDMVFKCFALECIFHCSWASVVLCCVLCSNCPGSCKQMPLYLQMKGTGVYVCFFVKRVTHRLAFKLIGFKCGQDFAFCETLLEICLACDRFRTICVQFLESLFLEQKRLH